ncbi:BAX inhibitor (BI)-1/YccA family protein [Candidatus Woesearchaeota archaeon]|nr:BAX inhibitor (BI)-1/YccA family protein [Candidatus Woesearchaeota archaeon]
MEHEHNLSDVNDFFMKVYMWMFVGMIISGTAAFALLSVPELLNLVLGTSGVFIGLLIFELALVFGLSFFINKLPPAVAAFMFLVYCAATGLTISVVILVYTMASVAMVFFITASIFAMLSIYGYVTKKDLTSLGAILFVGLIGIVISGLINLWLRNSLMEVVISIIGVIVFTGLIAYDTQKIKKRLSKAHGTRMETNYAVVGALSLYLDFINLFLSLLRLLGRRRS